MASKKNRRNRKEARTRVTNSMTMINPNTAGIDVGSEEHWVCVPSDRAEENVRPFGVYSCDFRELAAWLKKCGITSVAMESTGVYWIPLYQALEKQGFDVVLVNARHLKSVAGRPKTDVYDCQWIQRLHSYGLLNASFRPEDDICVIRSLQRHRDELTESTSRHVLHMQKCLQQMNVRLDEAVSDIMGKTGLAIIEAILSGEHNPSNLAKLRDRRVKADEKEIAKALEGDYREEHLFVLRQSLDSYKFIYGQMETCDREIKKHLEELEKKVDVNLRPLPPPTAGSKRSNRNQPTYDIRPYLY
jgi:transposase